MSLPSSDLRHSSSNAAHSASGSHSTATQGQRRIQGSLAIATGSLPILFGILGVVGLLDGIGLTSTVILGVLLTSLVLATISGYLVALLAPQPPFIHGLILMGFASGLWLAAMFWVPATISLSLGCTAGVTALIGIGTGGWLRLRQQLPMEG